MSTAVIAHEVAAHLTSKHLPPTQEWLDSFMPTIRPNTPINALKQTALFRILASDITQSVKGSPGSVLPVDIHNGTIRERRLAGPVVVQVLDIEDIGSSRWSQVEALEAEERGETTKGREIIRVVAEDAAQGQAPGQTQQQTPGKPSAGPHKLLLQDLQGTRAYAIELRSVDKVDLSLAIGTKMVLHDVVVARGVILLEPRSVEMLGGKIEGLNKLWKEGRKERLKAAAGIRDAGS